MTAEYFQLFLIVLIYTETDTNMMHYVINYWYLMISFYC